MNPAQFGYSEKGMSLRAWLAGQALSGILAHTLSPDNHNTNPMWATTQLEPPYTTAKLAIKYADAVIAELNDEAQRSGGS